jgi:hypothetical protein
MLTAKDGGMKKNLWCFVGMWLLLAVLLPAGCEKAEPKEAIFSFEVTADMRRYADPNHQSSQYFMGACKAIKGIGKGAFMVSPGDIDPPQYVGDTIEKVLGKQYHWYPVVGNHEAETPEDMAWLKQWGKREIPYLVRRGPENGQETTYSFDFKNAHFVVINQYYDGQSDTGTNGNVCRPLYQWLKNDLEANSRPVVFVFGHEPIVSIPDADNGRHRHKGDNLDEHPKNSHRFQTLLREHNVTAYVCGHTHGFSFAKINGLWQLDAGHARGMGDKGAQSTFLKVWVDKQSCWVDVYRDDANGGAYSLTRTITLE